MLKHVRLRMQNDDMTGVLMQRISRIPLSYRRKAKTPPSGRVLMVKLCVEVTTLNRLR